MAVQAGRIKMPLRYCFNDAAGNQTNDGLHNYSFNAENQITQMDGGAATYAYDGEGRRMKKTYNGETTYTFYDSKGSVISEFTTSNAIASAITASSTDKCFYHTTDKLGSAVLVMASNGTVIENNRTLPYGEVWLAESTLSTNDKKFTTYQRDQESGLDYAMNRYFSNANGRFISPDKGHPKLYAPITLNRFVYAMADPVNYRDPDGNIIAPGPYTPPPPPPIPPEMPIGGGSTGITTGAIGEEYQNPAPETIAAMVQQFLIDSAIRGAGFSIGIYGAFSDPQRIALSVALSYVGQALGTRSGCAGLLGGTTAALNRLSTASLNSAANAIRPPNLTDAAWGSIQNLATNPPQGQAALSVIGRPIGFLNDNFFANPTDFSGMATTLIHELEHMAGAGAEIDVTNADGSLPNYAEISEKCGTRDSSKQ